MLIRQLPHFKYSIHFARTISMNARAVIGKLDRSVRGRLFDDYIAEAEPFKLAVALRVPEPDYSKPLCVLTTRPPILLFENGECYVT